MLFPGKRAIVWKVIIESMPEDSKTETRPGGTVSGPLASGGLKVLWSAIRHVSVTTKLALMTASLAAVSAGLLFMVVMTLGISAGVRAYVGGEGLYSKAQKDAVYYLARYARTRSEQDYRNYLQVVSIPLGDYKARVELQKAEFDSDIAARGFIEAGNDPGDVHNLITMFRRYHGISYMRRAIELWTQADLLIVELIQCGDDLRGAILSGNYSREQEADFLERIDQINAKASPLEAEFSATLSEAARQIGRLLIIVIVLTGAILLCGGLWVAWRISRELHVGILNLRKAAVKVADGDLNHSVEVRSKDELGDLAVVFNQMIQHRRVAEQDLKSATEFREKIMQSVTNAIYMIDIEGRFVVVNRRICTMTGYAESELVGMQFDELFPPERLVDLRKVFEAVIHTGVPIEHYETSLVRKDKQVIMISFSSAAFYKEGAVIGVVGAADDITERKLKDARLVQMANYDDLTGLPNRNLLNDRITQALSRARRLEKSVALIFMDLDGFKYINDSLGHGVGDSLLKAVAHKLHALIRAEDTVARLGGDEFVVMLCDVEHEQAVTDVAEKILQSFVQPFLIDQRELHVTASIGVSVYPRDGQHYETLLQHADIAMYRAKAAGRNCAKFFNAEMASDTHERVVLEAALRVALAHDEFKMHYQPQLDLRSGKFCCAEALMRWQHEKLGVLSPARFIPLAEETGLILPIGEWALRTACTELRAWHELGHRNLSVAVNISSRQFQQQNLPDLVRQVLAETGVPPARLHLELTEGVILQHSSLAIDTLKELKQIGVVLAIDDFGTGYSSLSYLKRFPIDIIKIDQSFILDLITNPEAASIILAILAMAKTLKLKTVAEGVETRAQLDFLIENGCDVIQGFYLNPALSAEEFRAQLSRGHRLLPRPARSA